MKAASTQPAGQVFSPALLFHCGPDASDTLAVRLPGWFSESTARAIALQALWDEPGAAGATALAHGDIGGGAS